VVKQIIKDQNQRGHKNNQTTKIQRIPNPVQFSYLTTVVQEVVL